MNVRDDKSLTSPEEIVELSKLYDRYGELLKDSQRSVFEAYVLDNLSLGEIAEEHGITRQGVYDTLNRVRKKLRDYEKKLRMVEREQKLREMISKAGMDDAEREHLLEALSS